MLGSACSISGPPVVVYGSFRQWEKRRFRATIQAFLLIAGILIAIGHGLNGLWDNSMWVRTAWAIPVLGLSTILGNIISRRLPANKFDRIIFVVFIVLGTLLWLK